MFRLPYDPIVEILFCHSGMQAHYDPAGVGRLLEARNPQSSPMEQNIWANANEI